MENVPNHRMTVNEFLALAEGRDGRYELIDGEVFSMAAERPAHADAKFAIQAALKEGRSERPASRASCCLTA